MLKTSVTSRDGRKLLVVGLSFKNLDEFRAKPGDTYIKIDGRPLDIAEDVLIFSGETEAHLAQTLEHFLGPETQVSTSDRLKN